MAPVRTYCWGVATLGVSVTVPTKPLIRYIDNFLRGDDISKANALGVSFHAYRKYRDRETISWTTADRCAVSLGVHPSYIWEDWYSITEEIVA